MRKMELTVDLKKCKILYIDESGHFKTLEVKSIDKFFNENADEVEIIYLQDKGKKE